MNDFDDIQALGTYDHFTVFKAFSKSHQFPVVVKRCECLRDDEAEFFIRAALMNTKYGVYSQPLVSIEADVDPETGKTLIIFVWKKGNALDSEIEQDRDSLFPPGNSEYQNFRVITKNPNTGASINQALCLTLQKEVTIKKYKSASWLNLNLVFKEALAQAKCNHPNICEFFDFRLFTAKGGKHCVYIVIERLEQDLASEIKTRKELSQRYEEAELIRILQDMTSALLHMKTHGLVHRDIQPANILRGTECLKLADFGSTWLRGLFSETASVQGFSPYMSPEALETMENPDLLQKPLESDVFSLGMTMLHLAAMDLPPRTARMSDFEAVLQQSVRTLTYSHEFKGLLIAMLRLAAEERPTLETVREDCIRMPRLPLESPHLDSPNRQTTKQQADELSEQGGSFYNEGNYVTAAEMYAAAHSIHFRFFPNDIKIAHNLKDWGLALSNMENYSEAVGKCAAADSIYSRLSPKDINTAVNLTNWGGALYMMKRYLEAVGKYAAADSIYSRFFPDDKNTAENLDNWGLALLHMGNDSEAVGKYAAADSIFSRFFPSDMDTAKNLSYWALSLKRLGKQSEVLGKYESLRAIYVLNHDGKYALFVDDNISLEKYLMHEHS